MIDEKSKEFWKKYASTSELSLFSMMNLQTDPVLSQQKFYYELEMVLKHCKFSSNHSLLDLGGGVGLWSREFASRVGEVTLVEREPSFVRIAKDLLSGKPNCRIIESDSTTFFEEKTYDIIFMSGLTIYLNDNSFDRMLQNLSEMTKKGSLIIHRDAYGVDSRFILDQKQSDTLGQRYSAEYRTRKEYDNLFFSYGYDKILDIDIYPENKRWKETDLRLAKYFRI